MELAANIHARRIEMGMTLDALSEKSGVSRAMLSDIEREAKSPTVRIVSQIAAGLDCTISQLLGEPEPQPGQGVQVLHKSQRQIMVEPRSGVERHLLSPGMVRYGIEIVWCVIPPGQSTGVFPPQPAGAQQHITVVRGRLKCRLGGNELVLEEGDSVTFAADMEYSFTNPEKKPCRCFIVSDAGRRRG